MSFEIREKWLRALCSALFDSDLVASRLTLFLAELLWALMLMWPGETFNRQTYAAMSHAASEEMWAVVFALSAATQLWIIISESFHGVFARTFAGWNAALWLYTVAGMLASVYPPPAAIGGEIALTVLACWIYVRPYALALMYRRAHVRAN